MDTIRPLIRSDQLKTRYLAKSKKPQITVKYDKNFDALLILFASDEEEFVAHYVDDRIALLYRSDNMEIIGLQIEDFQLDFLPAHENVARLWQLRGTGEQISDMGDIILYAENRLPKVAREVAKATKEVLGEPGDELVAALV